MNDTYVLLMPPFLLIVNQFNFEEIVTANKSKCTFHDDRISLKGISNKSKKCKRVEKTLKYEKYHRGYIFSTRDYASMEDRSIFIETMSTIARGIASTIITRTRHRRDAVIRLSCFKFFLFTSISFYF